MHTYLMSELARIKMADALADAERHRRVREAVGDRPPLIDMARVASRLTALFTRSRSLPGAAGAADA